MPPRYIAVPFTGGGTVLPIPQPSLSATTVSGSQINLLVTYSGPPGATSYSFESSSNVNGPYAPIASGTLPSFSYTGLLSSTTYFFRARVQVSDGRFSDYSDAKSSTTLASAPSPPATVTATDIDFDSITVSWSSSAQATSYNVYLSGVLTLTGVQSPQTINGLNDSTTYQVQVSAVNGSGEGALSVASSVTTAASPTDKVLNWNPGVRFFVGGPGQYHGISDITSNFPGIFNQFNTAGKGSLLKGLEVGFTWNQLEGSLGDYSAGFALVDAILAYIEPKGYDLSIQVNCSGNTFGTGSASYPTNFAPSYLNSSTYNGGVYFTATTGPVIKIGNPNVTQRLIALGNAYAARYGSRIYRWDPFMELSFGFYSGVPELSDSQLTTACGAIARGLRTGSMTRSLILMRASFLQGRSSYPAFFNAVMPYAISIGDYDTNKETGPAWSGQKPVIAGTAGAVDAVRPMWGAMAFRGKMNQNADGSSTGQDSDGHANIVTIPSWTNYQAQGYDFHCWQSNDTLGAFNRTATSPVPPAHHGSGLYFELLQQYVTMQASHVYFYDNRLGPNMNRTQGQNSSAPQDYANPYVNPPSGGTSTHPTLCDQIMTTPPVLKTAYPTAGPFNVSSWL